MKEKEILIKEYGISGSENSDTIIIKIIDESGRRNLCLKGSSQMLFALGMETMGIEVPVIFPHKVMIDLVSTLGGTLKKVVIYDIIDGKLCSRLYIESKEKEEKIVEIATPDALTLALNTEIPVYTYESVFVKDNEQRHKKIEWYDLDEDFVLDVLHNSTEEDFANCSTEEMTSYINKALEFEDYDLAAKLKAMMGNKTKDNTPPNLP